MYDVVAFVGSLRGGSINRRLARAVAVLAAPRLNVELVPVEDLPMYNEDLWEAPPEPVVRFKSRLDAADGALIVTPEYNRTITPVTLNLVTWGSRPRGQNSWAGKPVALLGTTPGAIGTAVGQHQLRGSLGILDALVMGLPEAYITFHDNLLDERDQVAVESTRAFFEGYIDRFVRLIEWSKLRP